MVLNHEKTGGRKSRDTLPLTHCSSQQYALQDHVVITCFRFPSLDDLKLLLLPTTCITRPRDGHVFPVPLFDELIVPLHPTTCTTRLRGGHVFPVVFLDELFVPLLPTSYTRRPRDVHVSPVHLVG